MARLPYFIHFVLLAFFCFIQPARADTQVDQDIEIKIGFEKGEIQTDVSMVIDARPQEVWAVLTDFEHMASFISNLKSSKVISNNNLLTIEQKGTAGSGLFSFNFESIREIQLSPFESIRSHMVSGTMKKLEGLMKLSEEKGKTKLVYHADAVSGVWMPPFVGRSFIEAETREQFGEMRKEVMKRKQAASH